MILINQKPSPLRTKKYPLEFVLSLKDSYKADVSLHGKVIYSLEFSLLPSFAAKKQKNYYHPRIRVGNVFSHVCLSVCPSICPSVCLSDFMYPILLRKRVLCIRLKCVLVSSNS